MNVDIYFSDYFQVEPGELSEFGAFDVSLVNDLPLFVDPFLLFNSKKEEYQDLHTEIIRYVRFLRDMSAEGQLSPALVTSWFRFPEVKQNWLGYSLRGNAGRGLGRQFANALVNALHTIFRDFGEEAITRSSHLEKLCLVHEGVGKDSISDFTTNLIKGYLAKFTQTFSESSIDRNLLKRVQVPGSSFNYQTRSWVTREFLLPWHKSDYVLLTPKDMLTKDDTWINRPELLDRFPDIAQSLPNPELRAQVNEYLLRVVPIGPKVKRREIREAMARAVARFPESIDYYVRAKEDDGDQAKAVSEKRVAAIEQRFIRQIRLLVENYLEPGGFYRLNPDTYEEAKARVTFLKDVIENKGAHRLFYQDGKPFEREFDLQILYRLTWFATPSDISREVDDGRGPADFKVSQGARDKTIVEFKLAKNTKLERNLAKQAEIYEKASDATQPSLKVIIYFSLKQAYRVQRILKRLKLVDSPHVILIDARSDNKPSASKA